MGIPLQSPLFQEAPTQMQDKKQVVLDTALRLFRSYGYRAVGVDRVIAESGVAKMTLYKYFPSKNALIEAVLSERDKEFRESLFNFVQQVETPQEKLRAIFQWHDDWFHQETFNGCMFINAAAEFPDAADPIRQIALQHKLLIQRFIENILSPQAAPDQVHRTQRLAQQINQLLDGAIVGTQISNDPQAASTAWRTVVALLGSSLGIPDFQHGHSGD